MNPKSTDVFVHATAVVDQGAVIGKGSKIWHFCHIMPGARIGADVSIGQNGYVAGTVVIGDSCRIQNNVSLYDGVRLEAGVFVGPSAVFTNVLRPRARFPRKDAYLSTQVGEGATIGANATIVCGRKIGKAAMIGAGAVVVKDVPDFALVVGNPARRTGWVCWCGEKLGDVEKTPSCRACGRNYVVDPAGVVMEKKS